MSLSLGLLRHANLSHIIPHRRQLFNLPDFSSLSPFSSSSSDGPQTYNEQKILPYSRSQLYKIVADVESYPRFIPFCTGLKIVRAPVPTEDGRTSVMEAELTVGFLAFKESYVSKVTCTPFESVQAEASSTTPLFNSLTTTWRFAPCTPAPNSAPSNSIPAIESSRDIGPTLVTLDLVYSFTNPLHATVSSAFFSQVSKMTVKAFEDRCLDVYGQGAR